MFTKKTRDSRGRFDLLLLEDGEFFLDDYSAFMCNINPRDKFNNNGNNNNMLLDLRRLASRRIKGRLKICTKSIMFEPDDISIPLTRYSFKNMKDSPPKIYTRGRDNSGQELGNDIFTVKSSRLTEMREDGVHAPYIRREANSGDNNNNNNNSDGALESLFSLVHTQVDQIFENLQFLWSTSQKSRTRWEERSILGALLNDRIPEKFDNSLLVDFTERPLLRKVYYVDRILPLVQQQGCLMITTRHLYVQPAQVNNVGEPVFRCPIMDINSIHKRRYMLQQSSLEIFFDNNKKSIFLKCSSSTERDQIVAVLDDVLCEHNNNNNNNSFQYRKNNNNLNRYNNNNSNEERLRKQIEIQTMTLKWQNREIDNYKYLMYLNTMADRSVNDLTQYPVFPWVVQDYKSQTLDLNDPKTYRDLSKPIGALNEERLKHIRRRFDDMPRARPGRPLPEGIPPPFMYGTHYSTPGYVLFYIVRVAPEYMLCLQNGAFDAPDRMFFSIPKTWDSVLTNPADLKELIPEFYDNSSYSAGEFLSNFQDLRMGVRQNGDRVNDVELPPWANDPNDFINQMRDALESEYVSEHLHEWIDLIFGSKQKGDAAIDANNLFFHMTYEGAVDLEKVTDPRERSSIEDQIREFGQTPKQLFTTPHIARNGMKIVIDDGGLRTNNDNSSAKKLTNQPSPPAYNSNQQQQQEPIPPPAYDAIPPSKKIVPPPMPVPKIEAPLSSSTTGSSMRNNISADDNHKRMNNPITIDNNTNVNKEPKFGKGNPFGNPFQTTTSSNTNNNNNNNNNNVTSNNDIKSNSTTSKISGNSNLNVDKRNSSSSVSMLPTTVNVYVIEELGKKLENTTNPKSIFAFKQYHRSAITCVRIGENSSNRNNNKPNSSNSSSSTISIGNTNTVSVFTTSEDTTLKLHEFNREKGWSQRRSIRLSSLSLSSCCEITVENNKVPVVVAGSWDNNIYVYSVEMGLMIQQLNDAHDDAVSCLTTNESNGKYICSGSWDSTVKIWELISSGINTTPIYTAYDHDAEVNCVAMYGNLFVSGGNDGTLAVNDLQDGDGSPALALFENDSPIADVKWCSSNRFVCASESEMNIHDEESGWSVLFSIPTAQPTLCLTACAGMNILSGGADGYLRLWKSGAGSGNAGVLSQSWAYKVSEEPITAITIGGENNDAIALGCKNGNCLVYKREKSV